MTYLIDGIYHGSDDNVTAWCGLPIPPGLVEETEFPTVMEVCPPCHEHDEQGAIAEADALVAESGWWAVVGPCGVHILGAGPRDLMEARLPFLPEGFTVAVPTGAQVVGLVEVNARCDLCLVGFGPVVQ